MALLPVVKYGDPILRKKVKPVRDFSNLHGLIEDMLETMVEEEGIGLAANQVGRDMNLLVLDVSNIEGETETEPRVFVNMEIIATEGEVVMEEGCLSIPDIRAEIKRPETVTVKFQDVEGRFHEEVFSGLVSRVLQHEFDHLQGRFFTDYLPMAQKMIIRKRLKEISETGKPSVAVTL